MTDKTDPAKLRLDKYLWSIRIFKTRTLAAEACAGGKVKTNQQALKPSHLVKIGEIYHITIDKDYVRIIEVIGLLEKRQSATIARTHYKELSPPREKKEILPSAFRVQQGKRDKGTGRPTKKDRRNMGDFGWI